MTEDVVAVGVLRTVYDASGGEDGYVSIEVSPQVARSADATVARVHELRRRCDRLAAIRRSIGEGANINVTLIFAVSRYDEVLGLDQRTTHAAHKSRVFNSKSGGGGLKKAPVDPTSIRIATNGEVSESKKLTCVLVCDLGANGVGKGRCVEPVGRLGQ